MTVRHTNRQTYKKWETDTQTDRLIKNSDGQTDKHTKKWETDWQRENLWTAWSIEMKEKKLQNSKNTF